MKIVTLIARILLGLIVTVFGLNGFLHFIHMPPPASPDAGAFFGVLVRTHYYVAIFGLQVIGGLLLLTGQFVPMGLVLLGPIIVNIDLFHLCVARGDYFMPILVSVLWVVVFLGHRAAFRPIFQNR